MNLNFSLIRNAFHSIIRSSLLLQDNKVEEWIEEALKNFTKIIDTYFNGMDSIESKNDLNKTRNR